jgi:hypothetical protein
MRVSRQRVHQEYGVVGGLIELPPGLVGQGDFSEPSAEFGLEGAYGVGS